MEKKAALWAAFLFLPGTSSGALCASGSISLCALPARHRPLDRVNTGRLRDGGHLITFFVFEFTVSEERPIGCSRVRGEPPKGCHASNSCSILA
jgi:hypothetical protein